MLKRILVCTLVSLVMSGCEIVHVYDGPADRTQASGNFPVYPEGYGGNLNCSYDSKPYLHDAVYCDHFEFSGITPESSCCVWDTGFGCFERWCVWKAFCGWDFSLDFCSSGQVMHVLP